MSDRLVCEGIAQCFGRAAVLRGVEWSLPAGALAGLLGPSGAGKTTLLRIIAGLDRPSGGRVLLPEPAASHGDPRRFRPVGMVFQNLALWPHLSVIQHLEYVLAHLPAAERRRRCEQLLDEVRLAPDRWRAPPAELSGGEAQRLALARAVAPGPAVLLLDEPLAQVDTGLRGELLEVLRALAAARRMTVIYVSHAYVEIAQLCERVAVLTDGRIIQEGAYDDVYWRPVDAAVARLTGPLIEIERRALERGYLDVATAADHGGLIPLGDTRIAWRPQALRLIEPRGGNRWQVAQRRLTPWGFEVRLVHRRDTAVADDDPPLELRATIPAPPAEVVGVQIDGRFPA